MIDNTDLKFYLTNTEPYVYITDIHNSLGGYPSSTEYSKTAIVSDLFVNTLDQNIVIDGDLENSDFILINNEIIKANNITDIDNEYGLSYMIESNRGELDTNKEFHKSGDIAYGLKKNSFFNSSFNAFGKQYRCIAIKNTNKIDSFKNVKIYIKSAGVNTYSKIKIAIEVPKHAVNNGYSTKGSTLSLVDESIKNLYSDNFFSGRILSINSQLNIGLKRIIASFDSQSGIFTFKDSLPYAISSGVSYTVEQSPSQKISSGRTKPSAGMLENSFMGEFQSAIGYFSAIDINESGIKENSDLKPNEIIYLWFERDISTNSDKYYDNRTIFTVAYEK